MSRRRWSRPWLPVALLAVVVGGSGLFVETPYFVSVPGVTRPVDQLVAVPGGDTLSSGRVIMVTVGLQPANMWLYVYGQLNPLADLRSRESILGPNRTIDEYEAENERLMTASQLTARQAAVRYAAARGWQAPSADEVTIRVSNVSGPSAGLAFSLEILQQISGRDLTRGHIIAATGTITADGDVGPVGGLAQKVMAAERAGADIFLVPIANAEEAARAARHTAIYPVRTLAEAVDVLSRLSARSPAGNG